MSVFTGKCNVRELQLVTNLLYDKRGSIDWFYPPIGKLATFEKRASKADIISKKEYNEKRDNYCSQYKGCESEIPNYDTFLESFHCAGVPPLRNVQKYLESLSQFKHITKGDTTQGDKPLWIGYDTCALRRCFHSNLKYFLKRKKVDRSIGHVLARGVMKELQQGMDRKYKGKFFEDLTAGFPEAGRFFNQSCLGARLHRIGMSDKLAMSKSVFQWVESDKSDPEIIEGYEKFERNRNCEIILFSADKDFISMCEGSSIKAQYVEYSPHKVRTYIEKEPLELGDVNSIIYYGTRVFGMTHLQGFDLYSIWAGKEIKDWNQGYLKVEAKGNMVDSFSKAYHIIKRLDFSK